MRMKAGRAIHRRQCAPPSRRRVNSRFDSTGRDVARGACLLRDWVVVCEERSRRRFPLRAGADSRSLETHPSPLFTIRSRHLSMPMSRLGRSPRRGCFANGALAVGSRTHPARVPGQMPRLARLFRDPPSVRGGLRRVGESPARRLASTSLHVLISCMRSSPRSLPDHVHPAILCFLDPTRPAHLSHHLDPTRPPQHTSHASPAAGT